jgi:hypothetical protein
MNEKLTRKDAANAVIPAIWGLSLAGIYRLTIIDSEIAGKVGVVLAIIGAAVGYAYAEYAAKK